MLVRHLCSSDYIIPSGRRFIGCFGELVDGGRKFAVGREGLWIVRSRSENDVAAVFSSTERLRFNAFSDPAAVVGITPPEFLVTWTEGR